MSKRHLHVNCRKATELVEERSARKLGLRERFGLWMHLLICAGCRAYERQSALIDRWLRVRRDRPSDVDSEALQQRILRDTIG